MEAKMNINKAIHYLEAKGFLVKGYGYPESDHLHSAQSFADQYRVLQGDYDTGMISPLQLVEVAEKMMH
ncbi:hypothetical protein [Tumebacillus flagellatus]|uniref:Uncharacterized protein n=1 Tax=Tumebacillus flagellatus TaxID=1157490 RepID=A0A074LUY4_9BACL|nr:hypothetical protein [Tumebacillus flagellatus]KEO83743.1 hypothetical protein EL26_08820 [Tumebacillus flagellatus]